MLKLGCCEHHVKVAARFNQIVVSKMSCQYWASVEHSTLCQIARFCLKTMHTVHWKGTRNDFISSVSYQILINGQSNIIIALKIVSNKGDPFSHYLFILCSEEIFDLLHKNDRNNKIHGIKIEWKAPQISFSKKICYMKKKKWYVTGLK